MQLRYKIYNPIKDTTYVVQFVDDGGVGTERAIQELNREATGTKYGVVYDPENKWKFELTSLPDFI